MQAEALQCLGRHQLALQASLATSTAYKQLGLSVNASEQDVRRAYKSLAIQLHPDKLVKASDTERAAAEDEFKAVTAAYRVLID
eukprot:gene7176-7390_t